MNEKKEGKSGKFCSFPMLLGLHGWWKLLQQDVVIKDETLCHGCAMLLQMPYQRLIYTQTLTEKDSMGKVKTSSCFISTFEKGFPYYIRFWI